MKRKLLITVFSAASVALVCAATSPARADFGLSVFGSPYWSPNDTDNVAGGGLAFAVPLNPYWDIDVRGSYFEETDPDPFDEIFDADSPFQTAGLEVAPLELGGRYNFLPDGERVRPYVGAGASYFVLDSDFGDVNDEGGYYGLVGLDFGDREGASFFVEANYREAEATVEQDPNDPLDFEGFDDHVDIDLGGLGFNLGVTWRLGA